MRLAMRIIGLLLLLVVFSTEKASSQTQINPKLGFGSWTIKDEVEFGKSVHTGQTLGFDVYILHNRLLFAPGFHYRRISIMNKEEDLNFNITGRNGTHYFSIPLTFGLQVLDLPAIQAFVTAGGESTFFHSIDENDINLDDDQLHGVFLGLTGGAQLELFSLVTLDVKYHHALQPIIKARAESKLRGWSFAAGIKF